MNIKKTISVNGNSTSVIYRRGDNPVIVCIHGNSLSREIFTPLLKNEKFKKYGFLAYDLPGHGYSAVPANPEGLYSHEGYFSHLKGLLEVLSIDEVILLGVSLGGHIAVGSAARLGSVLKGLFVIGAPPISGLADFPEAFLPMPDNTSFFSETLSDKQVAIWTDALTSRSEIKALFSENIKNTDGRARSLLFQNINKNGFPSEHAIYQSLKVPLRVVFGAEDRIVNIKYVQTARIKELLGEHLMMLDACDHIPDWAIDTGYSAELENFMEDLIV